MLVTAAQREHLGSYTTSQFVLVFIIMYPDDIILHSSSVTALQNLLCAYETLRSFFINPKTISLYT